MTRREKRLGALFRAVSLSVSALLLVLSLLSYLDLKPMWTEDTEELRLRDCQKMVDDGSLRVTIVGGEVSYANNSRPGNVANNVTNDVNNGADVRTLERCFVTRFPSYAEIDAGEDLTFDSYGFCAAASGGWNR